MGQVYLKRSANPRERCNISLVGECNSNLQRTDWCIGSDESASGKNRAGSFNILPLVPCPTIFHNSTDKAVHYWNGFIAMLIDTGKNTLVVALKLINPEPRKLSISTQAINAADITLTIRTAKV